MANVKDVSPGDGERALQRIEQWLLTEVADELQLPGKVKITINLNENRQDIKVVVERFLDLE